MFSFVKNLFKRRKKNVVYARELLDKLDTEVESLLTFVESSGLAFDSEHSKRTVMLNDEIEKFRESSEALRERQEQTKSRLEDMSKNVLTE